MAREQIVEDPSFRRIVNTLEGTTNIVDIEDQREHLRTALEMCEASLSKHCGPTSGYAMLVDAMSLGLEFNPNIFTRDGIDILNAIEFLSPLETYVKHLITYVGGRVDSVAKDGTTTSMLLLINILKNILSNQKNWAKLNLTSKEISEVITGYVNQFLSEMKGYTYTVESLFGSNLPEDELMGAGGLIAFMQAMSSSGGNVDLSKAMGKIFDRSPKITWDSISYYNSIKENNEPFLVEVDKFDSRFRCIINGDNVMNHALGTEYIAEDAEVVCYPDAMQDYSLKSDEVIRYLRETTDERPVVVVTTLASSALITSVRDINLNRKNKISIWQYSPEERFAGQNYPWELFIFCAIAGIRPYCMPDIPTDEPFSDKFTFIAKKVHYHDTYLEFFGIVDMPEHSCIHPYYLHKDTAPAFYTEVKEAIEKQLEQYREGNKKDGTMYSLFLTMLNRLVSVHRPTLRLGGTTHEQMSNISVVQDVQGATMSSLNHGFLIAGPIVLLNIVSKMRMCIGEYGDDRRAGCVKLVHEAFEYAVTRLCNHLYPDEFLRGKITEAATNRKWYHNILTPHEFRETHTIDEYIHNLRIFREESLNGSENGLVPKFLESIYRDYPILHPVKIYQELMKRIQEIAIKFALTNEIIVGGGVVVKKDEGKEEKSNGTDES